MAAVVIPTMMRAVQQRTYGSADTWQVEDAVPVPSVGRDDVLIRMEAAAVDRGTWHAMTGRPWLARLGLGVRRPRNPVPGLDAAGTVVAVGDRVARWSVGDAVYGSARGSLAAYAVASADRIARRPDWLPAHEAAAIPVSGCTALHAVIDAARVRTGQRVLILGASGGVGTFMVQLAVAAGADVTAACSASKMDAVHALGAHRVIDYRVTDPTSSDGAVYDVVLDGGGARPLRQVRRCLAADGVLVLVGGDNGGRLLAGYGRSLVAPLVSVFSKQRLVSLISSEKADALDRLTALVENADVRPVIDRVLALDDAASGIRALEAGEVTGKVVIDLAV
jgi:NADPH:quinone reductase-like Zn-dependent oxidoreductase